MTDETTLGKAIREALDAGLPSIYTPRGMERERLGQRIETAVNNALGLTANEAEKDARRKVAVEKLAGNYGIYSTQEAAFVDAIIRAAQG